MLMIYQHISMISEGHWTLNTRVGLIAAENSALFLRDKLRFKIYENRKHLLLFNYIIVLLFDHINAALVKKKQQQQQKHL